MVVWKTKLSSLCERPKSLLRSYLLETPIISTKESNKGCYADTYFTSTKAYHFEELNSHRSFFGNHREAYQQRPSVAGQ
jgi:hypothetical protein